jgi:Ca-activated chloride channel family protein
MRAIAVFAFCLMLQYVGQAQTTVPAPQQSPPATRPAPSPGSAKSEEAAPPVFRTRVEEVNLIFTVTDKRGKFVKDLTQDQFKILDNNRPPKEVLNFEAQTDLPLRLGLLIDASNSIRDRFLFEQQAATEFLQEIIRISTDKAFVLAFDEVWDLIQDFTNDLGMLRRGIKQIRPGGGTAMWDAVYYACRDKLMKERATGSVRRAIILISDGDDNQSRVLRQEAVEMAQRADVIVYAISTNLSDIHSTGDKNLETLTEATGGRAFFPFKLRDLSDAFGDVESELRSQYAVAYKPADFVLNGEFRPIQITAENKKLKVRTRKGYFAPKE